MQDDRRRVDTQGCIGFDDRRPPGAVGVLHGDHVIGEVLTEAGGGQDRGALLGGSRRGGRADIEIGHEVSFLGNVGAGQRVRISTSGGTASRQGTSRPRTSTTTSSFFFNPASSPMNASAMPVLR